MVDFVPFVENPEDDQKPQPGNAAYEWNVPGDGCWEFGWQADPAYKDEPYRQPGYVTPPCESPPVTISFNYTTAAPTDCMTYKCAGGVTTFSDQPTADGYKQILPASELGYLEASQKPWVSKKDPRMFTTGPTQGFEEAYKIIQSVREKHDALAEENKRLKEALEGPAHVGSGLYQGFLDGQAELAVAAAARHREYMENRERLEKSGGGCKVTFDPATGRQTFYVDIEKSGVSAEQFIEKMKEQFARKAWLRSACPI